MSIKPSFHALIVKQTVHKQINECTFWIKISLRLLTLREWATLNQGSQNKPKFQAIAKCSKSLLLGLADRGKHEGNIGVVNDIIMYKTGRQQHRDDLSEDSSAASLLRSVKEQVMNLAIFCMWIDICCYSIHVFIVFGCCQKFHDSAAHDAFLSNVNAISLKEVDASKVPTSNSRHWSNFKCVMSVCRLPFSGENSSLIVFFNCLCRILRSVKEVDIFTQNCPQKPKSFFDLSFWVTANFTFSNLL